MLPLIHLVQYTPNLHAMQHTPVELWPCLSMDEAIAAPDPPTICGKRILVYGNNKTYVLTPRQRKL